MSMQLNPRGGGLMWAVLAAGALYLMTRSRTVSAAAAAAATQKSQAVQQGAQTYSTPTSVAAALGAFVAGYTKNAKPTVRTDNVVNYDWQASPTLSDFFKSNPNEPLLGVFSFGASPKSSNESWSGPTPSLASAWSNQSGEADSSASGAVYDLGTDFLKNNPFALVGT